MQGFSGFQASSIKSVINEVLAKTIPALVTAVSRSSSFKPHTKRKSASKSSSSSSSTSEESFTSPPRKKQRKTKHLEVKKSKGTKSSKRHKQKLKFLSSASSSSSSSSSDSDLEEGEIMGQDPEEKYQKRDRLFPAEFLEAMVDSSASCLNLQRPSEILSDSDQDKAEAFPKADARHTIIPFPKAFNRVFNQEWQSNSKGIGSRQVTRFYSLPDKQMSLLKTPTIDAPVAALSSSSLPVDWDIWPKDSNDRRLETFLRRNFELSSYSFRAAAANSVMARAAFIWAQEATKIKKLPKGI